MKKLEGVIAKVEGKLRGETAAKWFIDNRMASFDRLFKLAFRGELA